VAIPANPDTARGYSANLVLDEFAIHERPFDIWAAIYPSITNPLNGEKRLRIVSTPKGRGNKFADLWEHNDTYSKHKVTIEDAVRMGLPVDIEELKRAVSRVAQRLAAGGPRIDFDAVRDAFRPREKFLIRLNDRIVPVSVRDIAYFYSEAKSTFIVTRDGKNYVLDDSLDAIEAGLDPKAFFRISRGAIIAENVIDSASKLLGGRLRLTLANGIPTATDLTVSRARADAFLEWLEG
jgi:DNA-binding LytR/AlgR family response regulator